MERIAIYLCTLLSLFFIIQESFGAEFKSGERVTIDQRVKGDLYVATGELFIRAPIEGDLIACGGKISITDSVMQDLMICGGELFIDGPIGDDVRTAGGRINISSTISGDLVVFGGEITIERDALIKGDLIVYGGQVSIKGRVKGTIKSAGGNLYFEGVAESEAEFKAGELEINGEIMGASTLAAEEIEIGDKASFLGPVHYWREDGEMEFGKSLKNTSARFDPGLKDIEEPSGPFQWPYGWLALVYSLTILVNIILLNFFFNQSLTQAARTVNDDPARSLGYGIAFFLGLPIIIMVLLITIIGIPVGLLVLAGYVFAWIFGLSIASVVFARSVKLRYNYAGWNNWMLVLTSALAFLVLKLISLIPFIGWLAHLLIVAVAIGAILWEFNKKHKAVRTKTQEQNA